MHLNNAGAALMPAPVVRAIQAHVDLEATIGGYEAADAAGSAVERARQAVARVIGAESRNIAFSSSATAAFVHALSAFDLAPGDTVVTTRADYTSYQIQFLSLSSRRGVRIVHAEDLPGGGVDPQSIRDILRRERVRLVHVSWIPTHSGIVQDAAGVGRVCADADVPYLLDACQAVGQMEIDVATMHCDYLSATARKFLRGPRGLGFLYASDRALARGDHPLFVDMRGAQWLSPTDYRVAPSAVRFEEWEAAYALIVGLGAAAEYHLDVTPAVAHERAWLLAARLRQALAEVTGAIVLDLESARSALVTVVVPAWDARDLVAELRRRSVNAAATLRWYGLLTFERTDVESALRLSPHYYNTEDELEEAAEAIADCVRRGHPPSVSR